MERRAVIFISTLVIIFGTFTFSSCGGKSPTEVYRAYHAAAKNRDVETMLKYYTRKRVKSIRADPSSYHYLVEFEKVYSGETDGEVIDGNHAKIRVKDARGNWSELELIWEDGSWKLGNW